MVTFLYFSAIFMLLIICLVLCGVIMIQESKSSGLGASFGGESSDSLFGTSTADVLKKFTGWLSAIFMATCIVLSFWTAGLARSKTSVAPETIIEEPQTR